VAPSFFSLHQTTTNLRFTITYLFHSILCSYFTFRQINITFLHIYCPRTRTWTTPRTTVLEDSALDSAYNTRNLPLTQTKQCRFNFRPCFLRRLQIVMCFCLFQASTINRLGLQLSVEMDHEGCTSRPTKKQVTPFMHDLLFILPDLFLATAEFRFHLFRALHSKWRTLPLHHHHLSSQGCRFHSSNLKLLRSHMSSLWRYTCIYTHLQQADSLEKNNNTFTTYCPSFPRPKLGCRLPSP